MILYAAYENNWIEYIYGQNCGENSLSFSPVDPSCDTTSFLSLDSPKSGTGGPNNLPFHAEVTLYSNNPSDARGPCDTYYITTSDGFTDKAGTTRYIPTI